LVGSEFVTTRSNWRGGLVGLVGGYGELNAALSISNAFSEAGRFGRWLWGQVVRIRLEAVSCVICSQDG
jgi:hypothetical protein